MRAVQVREFGAPEVLEVVEIPDPEPGAGEVLVEVAAADVMFLDTRLRSGWGTEFFAVRPPYVPGGAVAGVVTAVGPEVDASWVGKRVATATAASGIGRGLPIGGYAERATAKAATLAEVPDDLTLQQAVALTHDGRTAFAVFDRAAPHPGETVLITAAGGGLGTLLIQLAHAAGAKVVAAARGDAKLALARRLGADTVVDYTDPEWTATVRAAGVRVVLDGAGGELGRAAADTLPEGGRILGYGSAAGGFAELDRNDLAARGIEVIGLFDITGAGTDWQALARRARAAVSAGQLEVVIGQTYPLENAVDAHSAIESRTALGRTLITVR
ncbi:zinc-binding dehydrogenase [Nocardia bovistercoris]|uniref:Zinc-binding dehydrogenase n=1 Tax=Nocardia bovistercoris TaxID=2785916 RepID=A0A931ICJ4_9NOCA|nr:zinc-binding dehydrogenase [Nocardia bovistercoris]MBH0777303.1 zinc-binding dehydrogenase [Nocardia bovistercoris]